jgi:protein TonB
MDTNKILSADILDLVFDDRNKEYGAYELRRTYPNRIKKSLLITAAVAALIFTGSVLANNLKPDDSSRLAISSVTISAIDPDEKKPEPVIEKKKPEPEPVRTEKLTTIKVVDDKQVEDPPPTQDDLENSKIDLTKHEGVIDEGIVEEKKIDDGKGIIEVKKADDDEGIVDIVQIAAHYDGNWEKFLRNNLNAEIPVENGAPAGAYKVIVQFVVDKEGKLSDIKALTEMGYGMEQEAIRVLKKATGWKPGIQADREVKSYHRQPITFMVEG